MVPFSHPTSCGGTGTWFTSVLGWARTPSVGAAPLAVVGVAATGLTLLVEFLSDDSPETASPSTPTVERPSSPNDAPAIVPDGGSESQNDESPFKTMTDALGPAPRFLDAGIADAGTAYVPRAQTDAGAASTTTSPQEPLPNGSPSPPTPVDGIGCETSRWLGPLIAISLDPARCSLPADAVNEIPLDQWKGGLDQLLQMLDDAKKGVAEPDRERYLEKVGLRFTAQVRRAIGAGRLDSSLGNQALVELHNLSLPKRIDRYDALNKLLKAVSEGRNGRSLDPLMLAALCNGARPIEIHYALAYGARAGMQAANNQEAMRWATSQWQEGLSRMYSRHDVRVLTDGVAVISVQALAPEGPHPMVANSFDGAEASERLIAALADATFASENAVLAGLHRPDPASAARPIADDQRSWDPFPWQIFHPVMDRVYQRQITNADLGRTIH